MGGEQSNQSKLYSCTKNEDVDGVKECLLKGASPNVGIYFWTGGSWKEDLKRPLHIACENGNLDIIKLLLKHGANVNALMDYRDGEEEEKNISPLHIACYHGHVRIVRLLLMYGASVNAATMWLEGKEWKRGWTAAHIASARGHNEVLKILLKHDAFINATTETQGWTPLHYACHQNNLEIVELLLSHGANINALSKSGKSPASLSKDILIIEKCKEAQRNVKTMNIETRKMKKSVSAYSVPTSNILTSDSKYI